MEKLFIADKIIKEGMNLDNISWNDFKKVDIRTGTIIEVRDFPEARKPAYQLKIDFGDKIGIRNSSAQITELYTKENLLNRQILAVVNFHPKQIGPFMSECLVTGFYSDDKVILATTERDINNGIRLL